MSNADWWSRRISGNQPVQRSQPASVPPTSPPLRFPPQQQQPVYQQHSQTVGNQRLLDESQPADAQIDMGSAIRMWKGGEAMRKQGDLRCPECGSSNVFHRVAKGGNTTINGKAPAPRCFECGWNGIYDQGLETNWA